MRNAQTVLAVIGVPSLFAPSLPAVILIVENQMRFITSRSLLIVSLVKSSFGSSPVVTTVVPDAIAGDSLAMPHAGDLIALLADKPLLRNETGGPLLFSRSGVDSLGRAYSCFRNNGSVRLPPLVELGSSDRHTDIWVAWRPDPKGPVTYQALIDAVDQGATGPDLAHPYMHEARFKPGVRGYALVERDEVDPNLVRVSIRPSEGLAHGTVSRRFWAVSGGWSTITKLLVSAPAADDSPPRWFGQLWCMTETGRGRLTTLEVELPSDVATRGASTFAEALCSSEGPRRALRAAGAMTYPDGSLVLWTCAQIVQAIQVNQTSFTVSLKDPLPVFAVMGEGSRAEEEYESQLWSAVDVVAGGREIRFKNAYRILSDYAQGKAGVFEAQRWMRTIAEVDLPDGRTTIRFLASHAGALSVSAHPRRPPSPQHGAHRAPVVPVGTAAGGQHSFQNVH